MFAYKRIVIAQHERGLYLKDRSIKTVLAPGVYRILDPLGRVSVEVYNLTVPEFEHPYIDVLVTEQSALCERHFQVIELNEYEVGLVYKNGKLNGVLAPAARQLYWKGPIDVKVEVLGISEDFALPRDKVGLVAHARADSLPREVMNYVYFAEVADKRVGLLIVDGDVLADISILEDRDNLRVVMQGGIVKAGTRAGFQPTAVPAP